MYLYIIATSNEKPSKMVPQKGIGKQRTLKKKKLNIKKYKNIIILLESIYLFLKKKIQSTQNPLILFRYKYFVYF